MTRPSRSVRRRRARRYPWARWHEHMISPQNDRWQRAAVGDHRCMRLWDVARPDGSPWVCARCGHRHHGEVCASHAWADGCGYDAGADCPGPS